MRKVFIFFITSSFFINNLLGCEDSYPFFCNMVLLNGTNGRERFESNNLMVCEEDSGSDLSGTFYEQEESQSCDVKKNRINWSLGDSPSSMTSITPKKFSTAPTLVGVVTRSELFKKESEERLVKNLKNILRNPIYKASLENFDKRYRAFQTLGLSKKKWYSIGNIKIAKINAIKFLLSDSLIQNAQNDVRVLLKNMGDALLEDNINSFDNLYASFYEAYRDCFLSKNKIQLRIVEFYRGIKRINNQLPERRSELAFKKVFDIMLQPEIISKYLGNLLENGELTLYGFIKNENIETIIPFFSNLSWVTSVLITVNRSKVDKTLILIANLPFLNHVIQK